MNSNIQNYVMDFLYRENCWVSLSWIHVELEKKRFKNTITRSELHTLLRQMKKNKLIYYRYQYARTLQKIIV